MSLKKKALIGVFWSAIETFSNQIIGFVTSIVLARLLMPEEFGLIAMLTIFMGVGQTLINSGLTQSLIRTEKPDDLDFSTIFFFNLVVSILVYILISISAPLIADFYNQPKLTDIIRIYCIVFIINAFAAVQKTKLTKVLDFKTQMIVLTPSLVISGIVGITLAVLGYGVWSLVWSKIAQSSAASIQFWYRSKWKPTSGFSTERFRQHFNFGYKLLISNLINSLYENIYTIIIGKFFASAQVGFYEKANSLQMRPVNIVSGIVNKISYPLLSDIQNDDVRLKSVYKRIMQMILFIVAPTLIFIAVLGNPIFRFIYTEKWLQAVPYFQILCVTGIFFPLHVYNIQILKVKGRSDLHLKLGIIKKIVLTIILIISFQYGIYGLIYGAAIFSILAFLINTHYSGKFINYSAWRQTKDIVPIILVTLIAAGSVYLIDQWLKSEQSYDLTRILIGGLTGLITFILLSWFFKLEPLFELKTILFRENHISN